MEHVLNAEGKYTVLANIENFDGHKAELNFISSNDICRIHIVDGEPYGEDKTGFWLDSFYAENAGIAVGDTLHITYQSLDITAPVLGLCNVPDHVYDTKDETEIFPSHTDYGFLYLPSSMMTDAFLSAEGITRDTYTSIMVDLDSTENADALRSAIRDEVANAQMVMDIHDEPSEAGYQREIEEGDSYVGIFSGLVIVIKMIVLGAVDEANQVGVLLNRSGLTKVAQLRSLTFHTLTRLYTTVELREGDDGDVQLFGQAFQTAGDDTNLLLAAAERGTLRVHQLQVVDDDDLDIMLANQLTGFGA